MAEESESLLKYRMELMENHHQEIKADVRAINKKVTDGFNELDEKFTELNRTLFERPIFVSYELLKIELESRDRTVASILKDLHENKQNSVSSRRHTITIAVAICSIFFAPFINTLLERLTR